jgi:hypothetical protein
MSAGGIKRPSALKFLVPGHGMVLAVGTAPIGFFINFKEYVQVRADIFEGIKFIFPLPPLR